MQKFNLGGKRLGSGDQMNVYVHDYGRSNHDLSRTVRTTAACGVLTPFANYVVLNGDTFDIDLDANVLTLPTTGPLFGSMKVQLDMFFCPYRLYQGRLHNNEVGLGLRMQDVHLPVINLQSEVVDLSFDNRTNTLIQINPSSLLAHLGLLGVGTSYDQASRNFNATPILAYWDIFKNYYANKQEKQAKVINTESLIPLEAITEVKITTEQIVYDVVQMPLNGQDVLVKDGSTMQIKTTGDQNFENVLINVRILATNSYSYSQLPLLDWFDRVGKQGNVTTFIKSNRKINFVVNGWKYAGEQDFKAKDIQIEDFNLSNLDTMRSWLLSKGFTSPNSAAIINDADIPPYNWLAKRGEGGMNYKNPLQGLALKTYQSDKFNNWIDVDSVTLVNNKSNVDVSGGTLAMQTLLFAEKIYNVMNRIAAAGGSYEDWQKAVYGVEAVGLPEIPVYIGGLSKELVFQEVVANSSNDKGDQALGTLGGRGMLNDKHKGGKIRFKADEAGMIIGIFSITPRVNYSQGNDWSWNLRTIDDLHKPELDGIGWQDSIQEERAWWTTYSPNGIDWQQHAIGKVPAWLNYMTDIDVVRGNFALPGNSDFMVFDRNFEWIDVAPGVARIKDATTYIDPKKYNGAFAVARRDSQNYWVNIGMKVNARRVMSAKLIPQI